MVKGLKWFFLNVSEKEGTFKHLSRYVIIRTQLMNKICFIFLIITLLLVIPAGEMKAQSNSDPDPGGALLRSLAVPGWGHHYVDRSDWTRGKVHLGADLVLIGSLFGLHSRANRLEQQFLTLSNLRAGIDVSERDRAFRLAIGDFNSLEEYNDFQLRSRNWNRIIEDTPENRWRWESSDDRIKYRELRSSSDRVRNQLPAVAGLMVLNRVISGLSAYTRARGVLSEGNLSLLPVYNAENGENGVVARMSFRF